MITKERPKGFQGLLEVFGHDVSANPWELENS